MKRRIAFLLSLLAAAFARDPVFAQSDGAALFAQNCASCHGASRLGGQGPALVPEALARLRKDQAESVIADGRVSTQMQGFRSTLSADAIKQLVAYIFSPLAVAPTWTQADIESSRVVHAAQKSLQRPVFDADPLNLFVVVETGDHHVSILDGDRMEPIFRFKSRFALHGGPKFTNDGRFVYFASRDGWVTKFDLWALEVVAEVRAGLNSRNIALSSDGRYVAVANYLPGTLVLLDAETLHVARVLDVRNRAGVPSRVSAVYQAPPRKSFIAALKDVAEVWEISTDPEAPPVFTGLVHSHEMGATEGIAASQGLFALRRIEVDEPLDDFFFDQSYRHLLGSSRNEQSAVVVNLNVGRSVARIEMPAMPHLGSGISWMWTSAEGEERRVIAIPHLKGNQISIVDAQTWAIIARIETSGPGFFLRSHEGSRYAFADAMLGKAKDRIQVIDKQMLQVVKSLQPAEGKTAAHVEFDRTGRYAVVSVWENDGALVVYDMQTLDEVKRLPMSKPSGKYNVYNKITFSEGTSH